MATDITIAKKYVRKHNSSVDRGIDFDLSIAEFKRLMSAKRCYYTGIELSDLNRSIDRVDNTKGYVTGNVVACDAEFNRCKGGITPAMLKQILRGMKRKGVVV